MRPRLGSATPDPATDATADPSRWTHRVGVTGPTRDRHPHLGTPSDLARQSAAASSVCDGRAKPVAFRPPPSLRRRRAFGTGGGKRSAHAWANFTYPAPSGGRLLSG